MTISVGSKFVSGKSYYVLIPDDERHSAELSEGQADVAGNVFDLNGRTLEEVQREAQHIRLDEEFLSFQDFNRCLDSWGVINHRAVARYKTSKNVHIRKCPFGKLALKPGSN
ncbi:unnamed protein product [Calypogeia fissa]